MSYISFAWTGWDTSLFWTYFLQSTFIAPALTIGIFLGVFFYKTVYHYNFTHNQPKCPVTATTMITMHSMLIVCDIWKCILSLLSFMYVDSSDFLFGTLNASTLLSVIISICISDYVNNEEYCWSLSYEPIFKLAMVFDFLALIFLIPTLNPRLLLLLVSILSTVCRIISFLKELYQIKSDDNFEEESNIVAITFILLQLGQLAVITAKAMSLWSLANIRLMHITEILCCEYSDPKKLKQLKSATNLREEIKSYFMANGYTSSDFIASKHLNCLVDFLTDEISKRSIIDTNGTEQTIEEYLANLKAVAEMKRSDLQRSLQSSWYAQTMEFLARKIK